MHGGVAGKRTRLGSALVAGGVTNGPAELLDFLIPLWAGVALDAEPAEVGFLVAVELLVSVVSRPIAGWLADVRERKTLAGMGALLYGVSCGGYALADSLAVAYAAAALGGIGGALLWVSLRAMAAEHLHADSGVFARLMSFQETGTGVAFVAGLLLLGWTDSFPAVFLACAAACLMGALILFASPRRLRDESNVEADGVRHTFQDRRSLVGTLQPMLVAVAVTAMAETTIAILLLLHLQRGFGLGIIEIAYVFLPGAIAMGVLPPVLHKVVLRIGRRAAMASGSVLSSAFAISLAWAPGPVVIAVLWILCGVAWAMVIPIEQAVVAERRPDRVGTAMGIYTAATLIGAAAGASAAGLLYAGTSWNIACFAAGLIILSGAVLGPWAISRLGVADKPRTRVPQ